MQTSHRGADCPSADREYERKNARPWVNVWPREAPQHPQIPTMPIGSTTEKTVSIGYYDGTPESLQSSSPVTLTIHAVSITVGHRPTLVHAVT